MEIELDEFESDGELFLRPTHEHQRHLFSHLLGNSGACCFREELDRVTSLAEAHGWQITVHRKKRG